jgi:hypothetical protein
MPIQQSQLADLGRKNVQRGVLLWNPNSVPSVVDQMIGERITDTQSFIRMVSYNGPDLPQIRAAGQSPPETEYRQKAARNYTATKNIVKIRIDDEAMSDNQYPDKMLKFGKDLRHNDAIKREIDGANAFLNYCNATTYITTLNGEAVALATHALSSEASFNYGATTYSNLITTPETPSASLLNKVRVKFSGEVNDKGFLDAPVVNFNIITSPTWTVIWQQIQNSKLEYGTANNNTNAPFAAFLGRVIEAPRLTHSGWTAFATTDKERNPWFVYERKSFELSPTSGMTYAENDTWWMNAKSRRVFGCKDHRGLVFNLLGA